MLVTPMERWIAQKIGAPGNRDFKASLAAYQLRMLQLTLDRARESRFYRNHLRHAPRTIGRLEELGSLPFTTAGDITANGLQFLCVSQAEIERVVTLQSSGSTGEPKRLYFTAADIEHTLDFFAVGMSTFTRPGDRVLILLPGERPGSVGELLGRALHRLGAEPVQHGPVRDIRQTRERIMAENITVIVGIPVQVLALARSGPALNVEKVLLTSDYVPQTIVASLEQVWGCTVYHHYGMTEMGLGGGVDCAARQGYHLREADLYFEIIDTATGAPLPDGQTGDVVFTTLTRTGMPLIRYCTGDLARMLPGDCPCGTSLRRMEHIRGRLQQLAMLRNGCFLALPDLDEALFAVSGLLDYRATVLQGADTCRLQLQLRAAPDGTPDLSSKSRDALFRSAKLQPSFLDGSLLLESLVISDESWFTGGVAKRTLNIVNS